MVMLNERETSRLSDIPPDIFESTYGYLAELHDRVYALEDPLGEEAGALIEEINSVRETIRDIFRMRSEKILTLSWAQTESHSADREEVKKMLPLEREMFDRIICAITDCRNALIEGKKGITSVFQEMPAVTDPYGAPPGMAAVAVQAAHAYSLIRVLSAVDPFMGIDGRIYHLDGEDVVTLPGRNAEVLCERNIALNIKPGT